MNTKRKLLISIGQRFGKLIVIRETFHLNNKGVKERDVVCLCDCGQEKIIHISKLMKNKDNPKYGCNHCNLSITHGKRNSRLYNIWAGMKQRTKNPNSPEYKYYGERGITMADYWYNSFQEFYNWATSVGYSDELVIDRVDVNGNYCVENCEWVTKRVSGLNKRKRIDNNIYLIQSKERPYYVDILRSKKRIFQQNYATITEARSARDRVLREYESQFKDNIYARKIRNDVK